MKRRQFLSGATLGAAAVVTAWPAWVRAAFGAARCPQPTDELAEVSAAFRKAQRAGKPLLCFIIPKDPSGHYVRGQVFGELLNHGSAAQLAPLALCEAVCTSMATLRRLVPDVGSGEPLLVLVETVQGLPSISLDARLGDLREEPFLAVGAEKDWERAMAEQRKREDEAISRRIAALASLLRPPLLGAATLARRAAQARAALPMEAALLDGAVNRQTTPAAVDAAAAVLALRAERASGPERAQLTELLAAAVRTRLVQARVPGSHWARSSGCGTEIEGVAEDLQVMVACGMGHVPAKSSRFLSFYVRSGGPGCDKAP